MIVSLPDIRVPNAPGARYAAGTWIWNNGFEISDGGETVTYSLIQASTEVSGKWAVTGSVSDHFYPDNYCTHDASGTLDEDGDPELVMAAAPEGCPTWGIAFKIIDARYDMTSPGYAWDPNDTDWRAAPAADYRDFLNYPGEWLSEPMVKEESDFPDTETSSLNSWSYFNAYYVTGNTKALWLQTLSALNFGGRLVYEADLTAGTHGDTCFFLGSAVPKYDHITGGAWWVDGSSTWGFDGLGSPVTAWISIGVNS
jgi:hypothetical protein